MKRLNSPTKCHFRQIYQHSVFNKLNGKHQNSYYWPPFMLIFKQIIKFFIETSQLKKKPYFNWFLHFGFWFWFCKPVIMVKLPGGGSVAAAVGVWLQVTGDMSHMTFAIGHAICNAWQVTFFSSFFALLLWIPYSSFTWCQDLLS